MTNPFTLTKEQYQELYQDVMTFSHIGGVVNDEEGIWKMCHEEFVNELLPAIVDEDQTQIIDGCADSFVVLVQLHNHFMSKPTWEQPTYEGGYEEYDCEYRLEKIIKGRLSGMVARCLGDFLSVAEYLAQDFNFNLYKAIKEVNRSNMTKFVPVKTLVDKYMLGPVQAVAAAQLDCEQLSKGKYQNVKATVASWSGKPLVVFRDDYGQSKIVKHLAFYEEPDFTHCLLEN